MLHAIKAVILGVALTCTAEAAQAVSPFDGLWVVDLKTQMGQAGFDKYLVARGIYKCESCTPPRSYSADGKTRPVPGTNPVISESVTISGPRTIVTRIVEPEMSRETTMTVAQDNRTATYVSLDQWPGRSKRLRTEYVAERVAQGPAGAHLVSGSWRGLRYIEVPEQYRSVYLKESRGQFTRSDYRYGRYTATIGGAPVPVTGDGKNIFKATVRASDPRTRVETILLKGTPLVEKTYHLSTDGRSMVTTVRDPKTGSVFRTTSHRESVPPR